jgi:macrolide transport system ATP-binding/permease protein
MKRFINKLGLLFGRKRFANELDEEMAFHREQTERELVEDGIEPEAAHYAAMRRFGNSIRIRERSQQIVAFKLETVVQDVRFALRQFRRNPGFAATAIVILALGMGASVAIFAFVDAALLKPLPYAEPGRLVSVRERGANFSGGPLSYPDYVDWKRTNTVFSSMAAYVGTGYDLSTPSGTEPAPGARVWAEFFRTLGIKPALGRDFEAREESPGAAPVVMLSYGAWTRRYGGRADVVGKSVILSGETYTVIGILPREFQFAPRDNAEFWTPLVPASECDQRRSCHGLSALARLKAGATVAGAQEQIEAIAAQLERRYPDSNRGQGASVISLSESIVGDIRPILLVLLARAGRFASTAEAAVRDRRRGADGRRHGCGASTGVRRNAPVERDDFKTDDDRNALPARPWTECACASVYRTAGGDCGNAVLGNPDAASVLLRNARWAHRGLAWIGRNSVAAHGRESGGD